MSPLLLSVPVAALAATPTLDTWRPDPEAVTPSLDTLLAEPAGSFAVGVSADGGARSWVTADGGTITSREALTAGLAVHLGRGLRLDVGVPYVLDEAGTSPLDGSPLSGGALGSVRARVRYGRPVGDFLSLGLAVRGDLGSLELGQALAPSAGPEVSVGLRLRPVWIGVQGGADTAGRLDGRAGLAVAASRVVWLSTEVAANGAADSADVGVEGRVGLRLELAPEASVNPALEVGGAAGLLGAPGVPQVRGWAGIRLRARPRREAAPAPSSGSAAETAPAPTVGPATIRLVPVDDPPVGDPRVADSPVADPPVADPPVAGASPGAPPARALASSADLAPPPAEVPSPLADPDAPAMTPSSADVASAPAVRPAAPPPLPQPLQLRIGFRGNALTDDGRSQAWTLAATLTDHPEVHIRLEVHVAERAGVDGFEASQARADAIVAALVARGVSPARVEALGFGSGGYGEDVVDVVVIPGR